MTKRKILLQIVMSVLFLLIFTQIANAGADWQEKQKQMFAQIPVKPGDVIDQSNWEKVKDILPQGIVNWVKRGEWVFNIDEFKFDFDYTAEWYELSAKNKGKYGLGTVKEIIDLKTGNFPMFIRGMPFPDVDVKNDPDGATKLMHNNNLCLQMNGSYDNIGTTEHGTLQWIGMGGYERAIKANMQRFYYWNRPDGEWENPHEYMHKTVVPVTWPFDLTGTVQLYIRHLDGRDDSVFVYVPAIRRIKRLSGANRSDPFMGADSCMDDADGFSGHVESMKWSYLGEKVVLCPKWKGDMYEPKMMKKNDFGAWEYYLGDGILLGWEVEDWKGVPWAFVDATWAPREVWIIKAEPIDPYYAYGMMELYIDKLARLAVFNVKYNKAGEYWKMMANLHPMNVIPDPNYAPTGHAFNLNGPMVVVDERTHHAMGQPIDEIHQMNDSPRVHPRHLTPQALRTRTK
jgi:hypothetical protein